MGCLVQSHAALCASETAKQSIVVGGICVCVYLSVQSLKSTVQKWM